MRDSDESLRQQLTEARDKIRRELEILLTPSTIGGGSNDGDVIAELQAELAQIEEALANRA